MSIEKPKIFGTLLTNVINKGICVACGACVSVCPVDILSMEDEKPTIKGKCILCQLCYYQCPRIELPIDYIEENIFGRKRSDDEPIGIYKSIYSARSLRDDILNKCQDGGAVTSILAYCLENGIIDSAVVSGISKEEAWKAEPFVALSYEDLLKCAGTRYTVSSNVLGLMSAYFEYSKRKIGFVGTPCQIQAIRRMQTTPLKHKMIDNLELAIGLFCMEIYEYKEIMNYLREKNIDLNKISKFSIKKNKFIVSSNGEILLSEPIKNIEKYVRPTCSICIDYTAELADISIGGVGSPEGWSTVIARSEKGEKIILEAEKNKYIELKQISSEDLSSIIKISNKKKAKKVKVEIK
jgi:coenzyme F420 hydrogenase subunit beta